MERPNEKIWLNVETMKLLNEFNLNENDLVKALKHLFPDVYANDTEKCLEQAKNIKTKRMLSAYTEAQKKSLDFIRKDSEELKNELTKIGIVINC
jgi:hypothetical protein